MQRMLSVLTWMCLLVGLSLGVGANVIDLEFTGDELGADWEIEGAVVSEEQSIQGEVPVFGNK